MAPSASIIPGRQISQSSPHASSNCHGRRPDQPAGDVTQSTGRPTRRRARAQLCVSVAPQPPCPWQPGDVPSVGLADGMAAAAQPNLTPKTKKQPNWGALAPRCYPAPVMLCAEPFNFSVYVPTEKRNNKGSDLELRRKRNKWERVSGRSA